MQSCLLWRVLVTLEQQKGVSIFSRFSCISNFNDRILGSEHVYNAGVRAPGGWAQPGSQQEAS